MTTNITMLENRASGGALRALGQSYTVEDSEAAQLIGAKAAYRTPVLAPRDLRFEYDQDGRALRITRLAQKKFPISMPAVISNPLNLTYSNEPVGIRVAFRQGECPAATYLKVKNDSSTYVDFQWEPEVDTKTEADLGQWPDGSLRFGTLWVIVPSLTALQTREYTVELYASAQSYSPTQLVTYTVTDASNEKFDTAAVSANFNSSIGWMLQSFIDKAVSGEFLATATGLTMRQKASTADGEVLSSTPAEITGVTKGRRGSTNTGYGVAYQEWECAWTWVDMPTTSRVRYRLWANSRITIEAYSAAPTAIASESKSLILNISANNTGVTGTGDNDKGRKLFSYADRRFLAAFKSLSTDYETRTDAIVHSTNWSTSVATNRMFGGWIGTTAIPAGAYWFQTAFLAKYSAADEENEWQRGLNPIMTTASRWAADDVRQYLRNFVSRYIAAWLPGNDDTDKKGLEGMLRIIKGAIDGVPYKASDALALFREYSSSIGVNAANATQWHTRWNAGQGLNFIGKNGEALSVIRQWALLTQDYETADLAESYIHALADFVVQAEITSGGSGNMKLDGGGEDNFNAEATACVLLAQSLAITPNATRDSCLGRIASRFASGYFAGGTRMCYRLNTPGTLPHESIKAPQSTYDSYQGFEIAYADWLKTLGITMVNPRQYLYEYTNAAWQPLDRIYQSQVKRRGLSNTTAHAVFQLARAGGTSDWNAIAGILSVLDANLFANQGQVHPQHGFTGTDVKLLNVMGDVRAAALAVWAGL